MFNSRDRGTDPMKCFRWPALALASVCLAWPATGPAVAQKKPQAKPVVINDELANNDPKDKKRTKSPAKVHRVKLELGVVYVIDLESKDFDAYLRLEDAAG